ncbi:MAG TPA: T9SS type A sorting domain-containing protein [Bacteroidota bacterium]|nr:T9SS type A sorting domain-containing protein [Bacteroidota bacterium]
MRTKFYTAISLTLMMLLFGVQFLSAQAAGDYMSAGSGNWGDATTWQTYNGTQWVPASTPPPDTSGTVTIHAGNTVTIAAGNPDTIKGAAIVVNGYLKDQAYLNFVSGTMTVNNGATYEMAHPSNSGQGIPTATWNTGSTCLLTGLTGSTTGINAGQAFYNLTINCPSMTSNLNLGWNSGTQNIGGNVTVQGTGASSRLYFCAPTAGGSDTVNIAGNLIVDGSATTSSSQIAFSSNGSGNGGTTIIINIGGNVTVTGNAANNAYTNFSVSRGSQGGSGTTLWNLYGNFTMTNATTQNSNTGGIARFVFSKAGRQALSFSGVNFAGGCPIEVKNGSTLSMGTSVLGSSGIFMVDSGATLECGLFAGLDSALSNSGTKTLSSQASYTFNATSAQVTGSLLPTTVNNLTIDNPAGVTIGKADTVTGTLTLTNGVLKIGSKTIIANSAAGGAATSYVATDSGGTLRINGVGSTQKIFPIGITGAYAPVWITNSGSVDTMTAFVVSDTMGGTKNQGGRVKLKWTIAENTPGGSNAILQFGWVAPSEDPIFSVNRAGNAKIFNLSDTAQAGSGSYTSQLFNAPFTISRGGISSFGTFAVGNFTGFVAGDGDYRSHQSGPWSNVNTWERNNGTTWIYPAPSAPTTTDSTIAIQTGHIVEVTDSAAVDQVTVNAGATLKIDSAKTLVLADGTGTDLTVLGTFVNGGNITVNTGASIVVASGGVYEHALNGGTLPTVSWSAGSVCRITGITNATSFNGGTKQNFSNFEWNSPAQTANTVFGFSGDTLSGYLKIVSTNTGQLSMFGDLNGSAVINGDLILQGGMFSVQGTSSATVDTVYHNGNISVTGGTLAVSRGSQAGSGKTVWYLSSGNMSVVNATAMNGTTTTHGGAAKFVFAKAGIQSLTLSGVTYGTGGLPIEVSPGTTLAMGTNRIGGAGTFALLPGATLESANVYGLDSSIAPTVARSFSNGANYTFDALTPQVTGATLPDTVNNLTLADTLGARLSSNTSVKGVLALLAGKLSIGSKHLTAAGITGVASSRYLVTDSGGTVSRFGVGAVQTLFPVGTPSAYSPLWITNAGTVDTFSVGVAPDSGGTRKGNGRVKLKWAVTEQTPGGSLATLQFGWLAGQEDSAFAASRNTNDLIVHLPDTAQVGTGAYTTQFSTQPYTLSRGGITAFGTFTVGKLGALTGVDNERSDLPKVYSLSQNYPNPFNPTTRIAYDLPKDGQVTLIVYNVLGQQVVTLVDRVQEAGSYTVTFSSEHGIASGVYFYVLRAGDFVSVKKMMLIK